MIGPFKWLWCAPGISRSLSVSLSLSLFSRGDRSVFRLSCAWINKLLRERDAKDAFVLVCMLRTNTRENLYILCSVYACAKRPNGFGFIIFFFTFPFPARSCCVFYADENAIVHFSPEIFVFLSPTLPENSCIFMCVSFFYLFMIMLVNNEIGLNIRCSPRRLYRLFYYFDN